MQGETLSNFNRKRQKGDLRKYPIKEKTFLNVRIAYIVIRTFRNVLTK